MSLGGFSKDKLVFDPAEPLESDNIGSYVRAGDDGTKIGHVSDALKVNFSNTTIAVTQGTSPWVIGDGGGSITVDGTVSISGDVNVTQGTSPWVTLDNADHAEDSAHVSGDIGSFALAVRNDAGTNMVSADGDYAPLQVDATGALRVAATVTIQDNHAEDSPHVSGDMGSFSLLVRQDTLAASTSADGDYGAFKSNARGGLWTVPVGTVDDDAVDSEFPVKIGFRAYGGPLTAVSAAGDRVNAASDLYRRLYVNNGSNIAVKQSQFNADNVAEIAVPTTALAGRRTLMVQNLSSKEIYIGATGVTSGDGLVVAARATISLDLGQNVSLFVLGSTASAQDLRVLELA